MNRIPLSLAAFVLAIISVLVDPLGAAAQGARARGTQPVIGQAVPRGESPRANGAESPRQAEAQRTAPPAQRTAPAQPATAPAQRMVPPAQRATPPAQSAAPVAVAPPRRIEVPRATAVPRTVPRVVSPQVVVPRVIQPRVDVGRVNDHPAYRPDYRAYRPGYRPDYRSSYYSGYRQTYRPYYTFRPRVRLGFGLWVGYPVIYPYYAYAYPYSHSYPYPYPSTRSYPYTYSNPVSIYSSPGTANAAASGGLSFDITPPQASVYVDGEYVGVVSQFAPDQPPLWLLPGRHHVEIREPGFEVVTFDVDITPGQVIPYHGDLRQF
jgi:PEGA domain